MDRKGGGGVSEANQAFEKYSLPIFLLSKSIFLVKNTENTSKRVYMINRKRGKKYFQEARLVRGDGE